jgi:hypothetical protein
MTDPRLQKILRKTFKALDPKNDPEYMQYLEITSRISKIEKALEQSTSTSQKKEHTPRAEQFTKAKCQAIAKLLWKQNPSYTITELCAHPDICDQDITGANRYGGERTVYDWIAEVDPRPKENKRGRPSKRIKDKNNNLHS